jgi:YVTN family beta-propeller protein
MRMKSVVIACLVIGAIAVATAAIASAPAKPGTAKGHHKKGKKKKKTEQQKDKQRHTETIFVGNNWDGTADILKLTAPLGPEDKAKCRKKAKKRKHGKRRKRGCAKKGKKKRKQQSRVAAPDDGVDLTRIGRINIIPDYNERMAEIVLNPVRLGYFLAIRQLIGEGHDQFVDDMYSSKDGELLVVSRPSFADVVGIKIRTGEIQWRFPMDGQRSDHMGLSPDGKHVAVSDSTANVVHILDVDTGQEVGRFESGDSPHENTYSGDGHRIYHASIGTVYTPTDQPAADSSKGKRYFQVVNADTDQIIKRIDMGQKLAEAGHPNMSSAVRPMTITPDEHFVYLQVSFFHGLVEYDNVNDRVTRVADLPITDPSIPREQYLLDSAHHGISLNGNATDLCVAGTMDDYAAIVSRANFSDYKLIQGGLKPYWATRSEDGRYCYVSWSGSDRITVISYAERKEVARIQVGDHPQRVRTGTVAAGAL